jgi:hypothetical protein
MSQKIIFIRKLLLLGFVFTGSLLYGVQRVVKVYDLPRSEHYYNVDMQSFFDLAYVYTCKEVLGIPYFVDKKTAAFALVYDNGAIERLNGRELVTLLAKYDLESPSRSYFLMKDRFYPALWLFVAGAVAIFFFIIVRLGFGLINNVPGKQKKVYRGYLHRPSRGLLRELRDFFKP